MLISLFIYAFYRTDKTLINQFLIGLFSRERYTLLKAMVVSSFPLHDYFVYCLPEGLWIFCITVTSSFFHVRVHGRKWSLILIPLLVAPLMELCQLLHLTNGRFDIMDILFSTGFWLLGLLVTNNNTDKEPLFQSLNVKTVCCVTSYLIVYLAHVNY